MAEVIVMIAVVVVFVTVGMNGAVHFMTMVMPLSRDGAGSVRRPFESGKDHADKHKVQDCSSHILR